MTPRARRRVSFVTLARPDLNGTGGQQRAANIIAALAAHADVDLITIARRTADLDRVPEALLLPSMWSTSPLARIAPRALDQSLLAALSGRTIDTPRLDARDRAALSGRLASAEPDIVFAGRIAAAAAIDQAMPNRSALRRIVDLDDLMSDVIDRQRTSDGDRAGAQRRLVLSLRQRLVSRSESRLASSWDASFVCSDTDAIKLRGRSGSSRVHKLPNIVSRPRLPQAVDSGRLLFVGALNYDPNLRGIAWFLTEVWPRIRAERGDSVSLTIAGRAPARPLARFEAMDGVTILYNAADLTPLYAAASACVVPLHVGGGTRIKIIEAMAHGRLVVSTGLGAEGLDLIDGRHYLRAESPEQWADAIGRAVDAPALRATIEDEAHDFATARYGMPVFQRAIDEHVFELCGSQTAQSR